MNSPKQPDRPRADGHGPVNAHAGTAALAAAVLWALTGLFVKGIDHLALPQIIWGRFVLSLLLVLPFAVRSVRARATRARVTTARATRVGGASAREHGSGRALVTDIGLGACMTAYYVLATVGFAVGPVALTSLIIALAPVLTLVWQGIATGRVRRRELVGFAIAVIGVGAYFVPLSSGAGGFTAAAVLAAAAAAVGATLVKAGYSIGLWTRAGRGEPARADRVNVLTFLLGALVLLPVLPSVSGPTELTAPDLGLLVALALCATVAPNILNTWASTRLAPTPNAMCGMLTPPVAGVAGWVVLGESLTGTQLAGMALALVGVGVCMLRRDDR